MENMMNLFHSIEWMDGTVRILDQRLLPHEIRYLDFTSYQDVAMAIREMAIRGAPAIGVAGGYGLVLVAYHWQGEDFAALLKELETAAVVLAETRPTAVNLAWAINRVMTNIRQAKSVEEVRQNALRETEAVAAEDVRTNHQISANAQVLVPDHATFIHHCHTGTLACIDYGTALGTIRYAHEHGKQVFVYVDETRPRLQGARLTSWELTQLGIPHAIIVDGASGHVMRTKHVDLAMVGCDRVVANGDTANKVGTYNLAIAARAHKLPFFVGAPTSTIDLSIPDGDHIPIEERQANEITEIAGVRIAPAGAQVYNPAFDVTPAEYITAFVTEEGIAYPPYEKSLAEMVARAEVHRRKITGYA
jgi:methylthioribose-1-phosphate isomerase